MFTLQETAWQLFRNKGRTIILLLASAMLAGCMAFYLGNIRANEEALEQLAKSTPVQVDVTNSRGEFGSGINIEPLRCDNFISNPYLEDFRIAIYAQGAYGEEARAAEHFSGGDCTTPGINRLAAIWMPDAEFTYMDGYDESFLATEQPLCLVDVEFAEKNGIEVGSEVSYSIYMLQFDQFGRNFVPLGEQRLKVIGTSRSILNPQQFIVPAAWMRRTAEEQDIKCVYNDVAGMMRDPRQLNEFKDGIMEMSFLEPNPDAQDQFSGVSIVVDDEQYISSAEKLGQNIMLFRNFLVPFFALVIGLIVLAIFLIMRNSRRDIAIASSLGRSKILSALANFLAAFFSEVVGCILMVPVMVLGTGLSIGGTLAICGVFLLCACIGNCLALALILRFDTFALLTAAE